jgi:phage RecT family recombinase
MTQAQREPQAAEFVDGQTDLQLLLAGSVKFRKAPLGAEDRLLECLDKPDIMSTIAHAFPDPALTEGERFAKARRLVEECRILIANSDPKVKGPLLRCTADSFVQALSSCASVDLSLNKALGQACLVPYGSLATFMVQYQGFISLIIRTGVVVSIQAETVYKGELDSVVIQNGLPIVHRKRFDCDRSDGAIVGVYAEARCLAGPPVNVMLNQQEIDKIKRSSKAQDGPWKWWPGEMAKKSAVRRLHKQLAQGGDPIAQQALARAIELDNRDHGLEASEAAKGLREHAAGIRQAAGAWRADDMPAEAPQEPVAATPQQGGFVPGPTPAKAPQAPPMPLADLLTRLTAVAEAARGSEKDMPTADWLDVAAREMFDSPVDELDRGQVTALGQAVKAGKFDPATGQQIPEDRF